MGFNSAFKGLNSVFSGAVPKQDVTNSASHTSYYMCGMPVLLESMQPIFTTHMIGPTNLLQPPAAPHFKLE
jgi:hypothetical protein